MACYRPIRAWRSPIANANGKYPLVFREPKEHKPGLDSVVDVPCGQCIGCKLERSRQWAMRCYHEASLYDENCYITLTYNDENLPPGATLVPEHFQKFMKRLRKSSPDRENIRYFHCGEYGTVCEFCGKSEIYCKCKTFKTSLGRPHYHACIFNYDFDDKKLFKTVDDNRLYTSEKLQKLWPFGFCTIGTVTFASAAYVARYITKKINGENADEHYKGRKPEYITMSRRPGIGKDWYELYKDDIVENDFVVINGKKVGLPKFYDNQLEDEELKIIKMKRQTKSYKHADNCTLRRLGVREIVHEARASQLKRSLEND